MMHNSLALAATDTILALIKELRYLRSERDVKDLSHELRVISLAQEKRLLEERLASAEQALKFYAHKGDFSYAPDKARDHFAKYEEKE